MKIKIITEREAHGRLDVLPERGKAVNMGKKRRLIHVHAECFGKAPSYDRNFDCEADEND